MGAVGVLSALAVSFLLWRRNRLLNKKMETWNGVTAQDHHTPKKAFQFWKGRDESDSTVRGELSSGEPPELEGSRVRVDRTSSSVLPTNDNTPSSTTKPTEGNVITPLAEMDARPRH